MQPCIGAATVQGNMSTAFKTVTSAFRFMSYAGSLQLSVYEKDSSTIPFKIKRMISSLSIIKTAFMSVHQWV